MQYTEAYIERDPATLVRSSVHLVGGRLASSSSVASRPRSVIGSFELDQTTTEWICINFNYFQMVVDEQLLIRTVPISHIYMVLDQQIKYGSTNFSGST